HVRHDVADHAPDQGLTAGLANALGLKVGALDDPDRPGLGTGSGCHLRLPPLVVIAEALRRALRLVRHSAPVVVLAPRLVWRLLLVDHASGGHLTSSHLRLRSGVTLLPFRADARVSSSRRRAFSCRAWTS